MKQLTMYSFQHKTDKFVKIYWNYNGPDAALQLVKEVGDSHSDYEILF